MGYHSVFAFMVTVPLYICEMYENSKETSSLSLGSIAGTYNNNDWSFESLMLEQINGALATLR